MKMLIEVKSLMVDNRKLDWFTRK